MNAIQIRNIKKTYSNNVKALKGVQLNVGQSEFFGLLGPNGAGKSTLIGIISSLVTPSEGEVFIYGHSLEDQPQLAKSFLGIVPQEFNFNIFETPMQIIVNQAGFYGIPARIAKVKAEELLRDLDIWDKHNQPARSMSGGQKRRLMIARALIHDPKILILDEPTAGVDISLRRQLWDFLHKWNQNGLTVILTTHYLEEAEYLCNRIAIIDHGEVISDTSKEELLRTLKSETIVCTTKSNFVTLPEISGYKLTIKDECSFEVTIGSDDSISDLLNVLSNANINVHRLTNKSNRLEELFVNMVENNVN